jgi:hypothetical protein
MIKRTLLALALVLLVAIPVKAELTTWVFGESDALTARVGFTLDDPNNIEIGLSSTWHPSANPDIPQIYSVYGIYLFDGKVPFRQPLPVDFLPETLEAQPYIGAAVTVDLESEDNRTLTSFLAGVRLQEIIIIEYAYQTASDYLEDYFADTHKISFGLRFEY